MSTKADFLRRFGPVRPLDALNDRWRECRIPCRDYPDCDPMFTGQFWTSGYYRPGEDPISDDLPWCDIAKDVELSHALAARLYDYVLSSDTDSPYFPCFFRISHCVDFGATFKALLGWRVDPEFEQSRFWDDIKVRPLPPRDRPGGTDFFWDPLDSDVVNEYFGTEELLALRETTTTMRENLTDLRYIAFPEAYVSYPVFWLGRTAHGSWVGLWALRVDT
ncbi:MAG: hypothetical protein ACP5GX_08715 [Anaerolineae bacterium]